MCNNVQIFHHSMIFPHSFLNFSIFPRKEGLWQTPCFPNMESNWNKNVEQDSICQYICQVELKCRVWDWKVLAHYITKVLLCLVWRFILKNIFKSLFLGWKKSQQNVVLAGELSVHQGGVRHEAHEDGRVDGERREVHLSHHGWQSLHLRRVQKRKRHIQRKIFWFKIIF